MDEIGNTIICAFKNSEIINNYKLIAKITNFF